MDNGEDGLNLKEVKAFGEFERGKFNNVDFFQFYNVFFNVLKKVKALERLAKRKFINLFFSYFEISKGKLFRVISIYKSFKLAVDCARTQGFNFEGIVKEAFESLGVGQEGEDCNIYF